MSHGSSPSKSKATNIYCLLSMCLAPVKYFTYVLQVEHGMNYFRKPRPSGEYSTTKAFQRKRQKRFKGKGLSPHKCTNIKRLRDSDVSVLYTKKLKVRLADFLRVGWLDQMPRLSTSLQFLQYPMSMFSHYHLLILYVLIFCKGLGVLFKSYCQFLSLIHPTHLS